MIGILIFIIALFIGIFIGMIFMSLAYTSKISDAEIILENIKNEIIWQLNKKRETSDYELGVYNTYKELQRKIKRFEK